jgi:adenylate cyclase
MTEGTQRRLVAIVSADVVGYSRLMGVDEAGTLAAMRAHRTELWNPIIEQYGGRVVGTAGDSLLIEYASAVAAVESSIAVQRGMFERNSEVPEDRHMLLRIGVNIGEVVIDGDDIFGDGVNVAARLQSIANSGGIAISGNIHEQVSGKLEVTFGDDGEHEVKNIGRPVHVWRWSPGAKETTDDAAAADQPLALPDKPSIAVLPFDNMSGDPEQEYFSDGITEDIITALSKFRWFFVTARNSTFVYKGKANDIKQIGRDLGVRYVLEGSVRRAGNRIRITAQLIEAASGNHIWAERYDRDLDDVFELQDEITLTIAAAVEPELAGSERDRALHKPTKDIQVWDLFQRGLAKILQWDETSMAEGVEIMRQVIDQDPEFGAAHAYLAFVDYFDVTFGRGGDRETILKRGMNNAREALRINQQDYVAHFALGRLLNMNGDNRAAMRELETSIAINPSYVHGYLGLAVVNTFTGDPKVAAEYAEYAFRLSPNDPLLWMTMGAKGVAAALLGDIDTAIDNFEQSCRLPNAQIIPFVLLAACYALAGRDSEAAIALDNARQQEAGLTLKQMQDYFGKADHDMFDVFVEALRKTGLS